MNMKLAQRVTHDTAYTTAFFSEVISAPSHLLPLRLPLVLLLHERADHDKPAEYSEHVPPPRERSVVEVPRLGVAVGRGAHGCCRGTVDSTPARDEILSLHVVLLGSVAAAASVADD